ncbi:eukaryotic translation initiation factor 3 subunit 8 [Ceratobasidium sp. AG-Ba]|nr:eukaryotic translation initiation factor 3 subunit 8 [Ceratobasidium sp. AG-Ba]
MLNLGNWGNISRKCDSLVRLVERHKSLGHPLPTEFLDLLISLQTGISSVQNDMESSKRKMNTLNARGLNSMKQKLRRWSKEFEAPLAQLKADPKSTFASSGRDAGFCIPPSGLKPWNDDNSSSEDEGCFGLRRKSSRTSNLQPPTPEFQRVRSRKNTDYYAEIYFLERTLSNVTSLADKVRLLLTLVAARFDSSLRRKFMPLDLWSNVLNDMEKLLNLLNSESHYLGLATRENCESNSQKIASYGLEIITSGTFIAFILRLEYHFNKRLLHLNRQNSAYEGHLSDDKELYRLVCRAHDYFERDNQVEDVQQVSLIRLMLIYGKSDAIILEYESGSPNSPNPPLPVSDLIASLATKLCCSARPDVRACATLAYIYYLASRNHFSRAKCLLSTSGIQESIDSADPQIQILFNRALVQLGLSAFRCGMIQDAYHLIRNIVSTRRLSELLAQSVVPGKRITARYLLPPHIHIDTELVETVYLVSRMLVEHLDMPARKNQSFGQKIRSSLKGADEEPGQCSTNPDNDVDLATKALLNGDSNQCKEIVVGMRIWQKMGSDMKQVVEMLRREIGAAGLRSFLFTELSYSEPVSLDLLAERFQLELSQVNTIVSSMIWSGKITATIHPWTPTTIFHEKQEVNLRNILVNIERLPGSASQDEESSDFEWELVAA